MERTSMRLRAALAARVRRLPWDAAPTWLLCLGLVVYLGLKGGGFDPLVHDQVGIALWWIALVGILAGALPRTRLSPTALVALGLLAAFVLWIALSLTWTESVERSWEELALATTYLAAFGLALLTRGPRGEPQRVVSAVALGIVVVSIVALLSRLHPGWFPEADQTGLFLTNTRERLSYPLNYWNGLAALIAIGFPLVLQAASDARSSLSRAAAGAALPALALTSFLTLSRGGIAATVLAVALFLMLAPDRLPRLLTLLVGGTGGAILIAAADGRESLQHGLLNDAARDQGNELLQLTLLVCLAAGLVQMALSHPGLLRRRPGWTLAPRRHALAATAVAMLAVVVALAAADAPGRASDAWAEFKRGDGPGKGAERLDSAAGQSRYQFWSAAVRQNATEPLTGTGAGTFEFWWTRDGDASDIVRDAHSLYFQTLGELGIVGLILLSAFLAAIAAAAAQALMRLPEARAPLAAALAGCIAFFLAAAVDWMWQLPVLPVTMLLLAASLVGAGPRSDSVGNASLAVPLRLSFAFFAIAAIAATAVPLAATSLLRESEADAREGDLSGSLRAARSAQNVEPSAASPRLQQALVLEAGGDLAAAATAASTAIERESTNWRTWTVLSRIEARRGRAAAAIVAYKRAHLLNPRSSLFER
jgi:hypothetical protein